MSEIAIIIGAARSGTSSLFRHLSAHPEVDTSAGKEPHYFCEGFYKKNMEENIEYESLWKRKGEVLLEATTGYTKYPYLKNVPENMHEYGIDPKFIYMIRDPIERFNSHVKYMKWKRPSMGNEELKRVSMFTSMYAYQIERFIKYYTNKDKYLIVQLEDFSNDKMKEISRVCSFLGIKKVDTRGIEDVKNRSKKVTRMEIKMRQSFIYGMRDLLPSYIKKRVRKIMNVFSENPYKKVISRLTKKDRNKIIKEAKRIEEIFDFNLKRWDCVN
jgi:hypothetical protein